MSDFSNLSVFLISLSSPLCYLDLYDLPLDLLHPQVLSYLVYERLHFLPCVEVHRVEAMLLD